jgi:hypothetical protein
MSTLRKEIELTGICASFSCQKSGKAFRQRLDFTALEIVKTYGGSFWASGMLGDSNGRWHK